MERKPAAATARILLYAPSHIQDNTYHGLCYTSLGAVAGTKNSSMGPPHEGSIRRPTAPCANALPLSYVPLRFLKLIVGVFTKTTVMKESVNENHNITKAGFTYGLVRTAA